ncbi:MAG: ABC transporter ATP-binding protein [Prochlorotrichaceae cyanobacterium]
MTATLSTPIPRNPNRESDWRLFLRLVPYARRSSKILIISVVLLIPLSIAGAVQPVLVGQAISLIRGEPTIAFLAGRSVLDGLNLLTLLLFGTIAVRLAFRGMQGYLVQEVGQQITAAIRQDLFTHVTSLAVRFFDRTPVGKLITRLTSDVEALGDVFSTGAIGIVNDLFSLVVVCIAMFWLQSTLALLLVLSLIPVTVLMLYFQREYRQANYRAREELSLLNAALQENIVGLSVVQIFRRERFNAELFKVTNDRYIDQVDKTIFHDSAISATLEWVSLVAIALVLWVGGLLVLKGTGGSDALTFGTLASFILFSQRLFDPLRQLAEKFTSIQSGLTAVERIADLLNEPIEIKDPGLTIEDVGIDSPAVSSKTSVQFATPQFETQFTNQGVTADTLKASERSGEIQFEQVSFAYKENDYVLKNLNFTIQPGEKIALVGPTGAGKSSVIRLLCRLYEPTHGRILVSGHDIRSLPQQELRRYIGVILQDGFIFSGDVASNIALGEYYPLEEIERAAAITNVDGFIQQLPQGYQTELRQRGTNLSAGQKQLLAFARVAVRDPQILVMDEATANLDVRTEALVQEALDRLLVNRTAIIIAHRLSTIRNVDRILVFKQGELVESGDHETLLALEGLYASLYQLQMLEE